MKNLQEHLETLNLAFQDISFRLLQTPLVRGPLRRKGITLERRLIKLSLKASRSNR